MLRAFLRRAMLFAILFFERYFYLLQRY